MNHKDMEEIERYLKEDVTAEEKQRIEDRILVDTPFRKRVEVFKEYRLMHQPESQQFRKVLDKVQSEYRHQTTSGSAASPAPRKYLLIAASISLICVLGAIAYFSSLYEPKPEALYARYFTLPADNITVRGDEAQALLNQAMAYYNDQNFESAIQQFDSWQQKNPDSAAVSFYSAISHMALDELQPAIAQLEKVVSNRSSTTYLFASRWYLALAYLKNNQSESSKKILKELAKGSSSYALKAQQLLGEL